MSVCRKPGFKKSVEEHNIADIPIVCWNFCPKLLSVSAATNHSWITEINRYAESLHCSLAECAGQPQAGCASFSSCVVKPWKGHLFSFPSNHAHAWSEEVGALCCGKWALNWRDVVLPLQKIVLSRLVRASFLVIPFLHRPVGGGSPGGVAAQQPLWGGEPEPAPALPIVRCDAAPIGRGKEVP